MIDNEAVLLIVPIVIGLVEIAKRAGLRAQFQPVVALAFGVGGAFLVGGEDWRATVLTGLVMGLSASGLYSGFRATAQV